MKKRLFSYLLAAALLLTLVPVGARAADFLYGDVNGDGRINAKDATLILRYSVRKLTDLSNFDMVAADVNADGGVNAKDATMILRYSVKKLDKFSADTHDHSYSSEITKAATCTEDGVKTFFCSCGDSYTESISKTGHSYTSVVTEPTCESKGYTTHTCGNCGNSYTDTETAALGHKWSEWKATKAPTTSAEGEDTRTCTTCGVTETRAVDKLPEETEPETGCTSHEYEWVCDSSWEFDTGTCKNCGETKVIYASSSTTSQAVVDAINAYRKAAGLSELSFDTRYNTRVCMRAAEVQNVQFSHQRPDGSQPGGTECLTGASNAQSAADHWYNSSGHNKIIMNPNATRATAAYNGTCWVVWIF